MFFITPILAGLLIVGTLGTGAYVERQAEVTISSYNLASVVRFLEIYYVDYGSYPSNLETLVDGGEIKNLDTAKYLYNSFDFGQKVRLCEVDSASCWNSF